jgi:cell wall assembly regulator SMI1
MLAADLWNRYVAWLAAHVPAAHANLAPGASDERIGALEQALQASLPEPVKVVWRINDGQRATMLTNHIVKATPCVPTLSFLSTEMVGRVWSEWEALRRDVPPDQLAELHSGTRSVVKGVVKPLYTSASWIPLWADPARADYVGLDLDPDTGGAMGQIINFGRNEDDHHQFATDFEDLLVFLVDEVEAGGWQASEMGYGDETIPWFGQPKQHFFNSLHERWQERNPRPPRQKA